MLIIRSAKSSDRSGIDQITQEYNDHEYSHAPSYFDEVISTQKIIVALIGRKVVGYLTYHIIWGNTPYIELLRITAKYQRKGIGSQLLDQLEKKLKKDGYEEVVSSSEKINSIGNIFHQKQGFKTIGHLNMIYGVEIFYRKSID